MTRQTYDIVLKIEGKLIKNEISKSLNLMILQNNLKNTFKFIITKIVVIKDQLETLGEPHSDKWGQFPKNKFYTTIFQEIMILPVLKCKIF